MRKIAILILVVIFAASFSGCAVNFFQGKPEQERQIRKLQSEVDDLELAKRELEEKLAREISDKQVLLELAGRGLVISMSNEILFDSGKAKLKGQSHEVLKTIASVIKDKVPDRNIGVEGHTDNVPIKHSGWKSNWELSTARATSVVHYLIDECGIKPQRLSAIGYGEYRPVASNDSASGRMKNRRVEIVILPKEITKKSYEEAEGKVSERARIEEESKIEEDLK